MFSLLAAGLTFKDTIFICYHKCVCFNIVKNSISLVIEFMIMMSDKEGESI